MKKILIIDDEEDLVNMTAICLKRWGYEPIKAFSGREGIEILQEKKPDLIIIDLKMPNVSGYDVCENIKLNNKLNNIPVIISTASVTFDIKKLLGQTGAKDIVIKPYDNQDLKKKIKNLLK